jgi:hypothetical protein
VVAVTAVDPQPGDWVLIRAKVLERPFPETVLVELWSKTDQYQAHVRPDLCVQIVPKPIPDEPAEGAVVMLNAAAYQRVGGEWFRAGYSEGYAWEQLHRSGDAAVVWP